MKKPAKKGKLAMPKDVGAARAAVAGSMRGFKKAGRGNVRGIK